MLHSTAVNAIGIGTNRLFDTLVGLRTDAPNKNKTADRIFRDIEIRCIKSELFQVTDVGFF